MSDLSFEEQYYQLTVAGYRYELNRLVSVVLQEQFNKTLPVFIKKKQLLEMQRRGAFKNCLQNLSLNGGYSMKAENPTIKDNSFYNYIDLAAACCFFEGLTIPVSQLHYEHVDNHLQMLLSQKPGTRHDVSSSIAESLNRADTMRVTMALKLLGLLPAESHRFRQLSLGALFGDRDIKFMHQQPTISPQSPISKNTKINVKDIPPLTFRTVTHNARDIVLVDLDPGVSAHYAKLNETGHGKILAFNSDVLIGLDRLYEEIQVKNKKLRNLVVLFRLEPMMLPDIDLFFEKLSRVIDNNTRFIVTVGAGDDVEAYRHRKSKMDEIAEKFSAKGFHYERLKWCKGDTPEEQRELPIMGIGNYSSYDIIYCDIMRDKL